MLHELEIHVHSMVFQDNYSIALKGAEENQVERNVLVRTVEAASHSTFGTQRTVEEQLGRHKPNTVWIK
jgi:hypothetical protein